MMLQFVVIFALFGVVFQLLLDESLFDTLAQGLEDFVDEEVFLSTYLQEWYVVGRC